MTSVAAQGISVVPQGSKFQGQSEEVNLKDIIFKKKSRFSLVYSFKPVPIGPQSFPNNISEENQEEQGANRDEQEEQGGRSVREGEAEGVNHIHQDFIQLLRFCLLFEKFWRAKQDFDV